MNALLKRIPNAIQWAVQWLRGREPILLLAILLLTVGVFAFIKIASAVLQGETLAFDKWVVRSMRRVDDPATPVGPPFLHEIGRDATALGGVGALTLFTVAVAGYLWIDNKRRMMGFLLLSTIGGLVTSLLLKQAFARPRPSVVPHLSIVESSSFPSGHTMLSAIIYLTLGTLLATVVAKMSLKIYVLTVAVLLTIIVGISRVYLGVHYPTDVLAGWMAGLVWALMCWTIARGLQRCRQIEVEPHSTSCSSWSC